MSENNTLYDNMPIKCASMYKGCIWISNYLFNGLFCFDCTNDCIKYIGKFENQKIGMNLHRQVICYEDVLFFIPINGIGIDVYNIRRQCFEDTIYTGCNERITNRIAIQINEKMVLLFSQKVQDSLYVLNLKERKIQCIPEWKECIKQILSENKNYLVSAGGICIDKNSIYLSIYGEGVVLAINIVDKKITKVIDDEQYSFANICCCADSLFMTETDNSRVLQIDEKGIVHVLKNEAKKVGMSYSGMVCVNNGILLLPYLLDDIYFIDLKKREIRLSNINFNKDKNQMPCFFSWQIYESNIILYPGRAKKIVSINIKNLKKYEINLNVSKNFPPKWIYENILLSCYNKEDGIIQETDLSLQGFLEILK